MTATHVLNKGSQVGVLYAVAADSIIDLMDGKIALFGEDGQPISQTYTKANGQIADLALIKLPKAPIISLAKGIKILSRSSCTFDDSVFVGDRLIAFGFPDIAIFDFIKSGRPFATSGIVAYKTIHSYLFDKEIHPGMSGGLVFKEYPVMGECQYKAVGLLSADLNRYDQYSWITKLDYIDSILISVEGKKWGSK